MTEIYLHIVARMADYSLLARVVPELSWSGDTLAEGGEAAASQRLLMEELASMERLDRSDNSYGR